MNKKMIITHVLTLLLGLLAGFLGHGLQKPAETTAAPPEKPVPTVTAGEPVIVDGGVDQPVPMP